MGKGGRKEEGEGRKERGIGRKIKMVEKRAVTRDELQDCGRAWWRFTGWVTVPSQPSKDPLHGVTLEVLLTELVAAYGWEELGGRIDIRCFKYDPSIKSSLQFLRKTPWARTKVEELYLRYKAGG
jgi:DNA-binding protein VF530